MLQRCGMLVAEPKNLSLEYAQFWSKINIISATIWKSAQKSESNEKSRFWKSGPEVEWIKFDLRYQVTSWRSGLKWSDSVSLLELQVFKLDLLATNWRQALCILPIIILRLVGWWSTWFKMSRKSSSSKSSNANDANEKNSAAIREFQVGIAENKKCFECDQRGPTYVDMTIGSFVCTKCSGML